MASMRLKCPATRNTLGASVGRPRLRAQTRMYCWIWSSFIGAVPLGNGQVLCKDRPAIPSILNGDGKTCRGMLKLAFRELSDFCESNTFQNRHKAVCWRAKMIICQRDLIQHGLYRRPNPITRPVAQGDTT